MSKLYEYIINSGCFMHDCPYGRNTPCIECKDRMLKEHDLKVRADAIYEYYAELMAKEEYLRRCHLRIDSLEKVVQELGELIGHNQRFMREQIGE